MKYFTLSILLIIILISACTKNDNSDPDQILLLSKTINYNSIIDYKYNSENFLIEADHKLSNGETYVFLYYYTPEKWLSHYVWFEIKDEESTMADSFKYNMDEGYYTHYGLFGYRPSIHYFDDQNRVYYSNHDNRYSVYSNFVDEYNTIDSYFNEDSIFKGDIEFTFDNKKNPYNFFPYLSWWNHEHNVISKQSEYVNEEREIYFDLFPNSGGPGLYAGWAYTSIFTYNPQGYPIKEARLYDVASMVEETYFFYRRAN